MLVRSKGKMDATFHNKVPSRGPIYIVAGILGEISCCSHSEYTGVGTLRKLPESGCVERLYVYPYLVFLKLLPRSPAVVGLGQLQTMLSRRLRLGTQGAYLE